MPHDSKHAFVSPFRHPSTSILSLSQNQQMRKIINKYKMYSQPLHMFRQMNFHPQGVFAEICVGVENTSYTC
jgi:hypothetical protein